MTAQNRIKPTIDQIQRGTYKWRDGQYYKLCTGPAHEAPEYLPATEKYFYFHKRGKQEGKPTSRCRLCINWAKLKAPDAPYRGLIPARNVRPFFNEAVNRVGLAELVRRSGVSEKTIRRVLVESEHMIQKELVRKVLLELTSMQRKNEMSINAGSRWRQERRNGKGYAKCEGCGGPKSDITGGCRSCWDRWYRWRRTGKISVKEYELAMKLYEERK